MPFIDAETLESNQNTRNRHTRMKVVNHGNGRRMWYRRIQNIQNFSPSQHAIVALGDPPTDLGSGTVVDGLLWPRTPVDRLIFTVADIAVASNAIFLFGLHLAVDEPEGMDMTL